MPRTQAAIAADRKFKSTVKQIMVTFKQDDETLAWLRSQVTQDSEIPALIKRLLTALI